MINRNPLVGVVFAVAVFGTFLLPSASQAQAKLGYTDDKAPVNAPVVGFSARGMFGLIGEGLTEMVRREYPGSAFVYEPGNPAGGLAMLASGDRAFALQTPTELNAAFRGDSPFKQAYPRETFKPVARIAGGFAAHVYIRQAFLDEHGIKSLADIKTKKIPVRISTISKGNLLMQGISKIVLEHYGLSYESILESGGEVLYLSTRPSNDLMRNGKLDIVFTAGNAPNSQITEIASSTPIKLLAIPRPAVDRMIAELGMEEYIIPKSAYPDLLTEDQPTAAAYFLLSAGKAAKDADAYKLARSLHRQIKYYQSLHPVLSTHTPNLLVMTGDYPLHPAALAYYRGVGLLPASAGK